MNKTELEQENKELLVYTEELEEENEELETEIDRLKEELEDTTKKFGICMEDIKTQVSLVNKNLSKIDQAYEITTPKTFEELMDAKTEDIFTKEPLTKNILKRETFFHNHKYLLITNGLIFMDDLRITKDNFKDHQEDLRIRTLIEDVEWKL